MSSTFYNFTVKNADGKPVNLGDKYKGKVVVVVNVASECNQTDKNYGQFKEVLDKYKSEGLEIAAFPCNQFGSEEPACEADIKELQKSKYHFEPDLYAKIDVNGDNADPLYKFLKNEQTGTLLNAIKWNFTKFLVDREGNVVKRYGPLTEPKSMVGDIEAALKAQPIH